MTTEQDKATSLKDMKAFEKWRKSLQYITGLGMTEEEQKNFRGLMQKELEEYQCNKCEVWKENLLKNSKSFKQLCNYHLSYAFIHRSTCQIYGR